MPSPDSYSDDAARQERPEALPAVPVKRDGDGVFRQPGVAVTLRDLAGQHRADGAVDVADRVLDAHRLRRVPARPRLGDQLLVQRLVEMMVWRSRMVDGDARASARLVQDLR